MFVLKARAVFVRLLEAQPLVSTCLQRESELDRLHSDLLLFQRDQIGHAKFFRLPLSVVAQAYHHTILGNGEGRGLPDSRRFFVPHAIGRRGVGADAPRLRGRDAHLPALTMESWLAMRHAW